MTESPTARRIFAAILAMSGLISGCGQATYAERVERTRRLFAYQDRLDQNLQAEWSRPDWGLALRPPTKFRLMAAPAPPKTNEEGVTEVTVDTRQPSYLGVELPGLVAAWEVPGEAFLYLCSNHQRLADSQAATPSGDPEAFLLDLEGVLQQGFEFSMAPEAARGPSELHAKLAERIPATDEFAPVKSFDSIRIQKPTDIKFEANVFEHKAGPIQVALILVYSPATRGSFERSLRVGLETLRAEPVAPKATPTPAAGGPAGSAPRPAAF